MCWTLVGLLMALQCLLLIWLTMILKLAWKVISGQAAEDDRSDDEDSEEVEEKMNNTEKDSRLTSNHSINTLPMDLCQIQVAQSTSKRKPNR